jgi:uncharacterized secreted protein with C-terminal beta-propeller domain
MTRTSVAQLLAAAFCSTSFLVACSSGNDTEGTNDGDHDITPGVFESADPSGQTQGRGLTEAPSADGSGGSGSGNDNAGGESDNPSRAIEEADIIKTENGKLYALSQYGGLSVIDVSTRDKLTLLGRHKVVAMPFEMYVHDGVVFALYQGYGEYVQDEAKQITEWVQTSKVVIIDARDPSNPAELSTFTVPGAISDSRIVGDILYVASYEDGYCWGCQQNTPRTTLISLDVSTPSDVKKVDELDFDDRTDTYSWRRSIAVTDQRIYVAGPNWGNDGPVGSTIQVVDIADPRGDMKEGAAVQIAGQINSRWQMDEYQGVLRVISQTPQWNTTVQPSIETFTVASSSQVTALGQASITLPANEVLQSVRFDGPRGYAITAQQTDPLFTIDLSDPAHPAQVGELHMPGWVYHMEPRGDRLLGLGYDQNNPEGALAISLFDVSDLAAPTMLARVNFGGDWSWLAEDQDRIHKAFNVIDEAGLILMPFSGYSSSASDVCYYGGWQSGIQLIDWSNDTLQIRGVAPSKSQSRRGFLYEDRLFAVSDERVETFDIANRSAPLAKASLPLTQNVTYTVPAGDRVLRVGQNWWTNSTELDVTTLAQVSSPITDGKLELITANNKACYENESLQSVFGSDDRARLVYQKYTYDSGSGASQQSIRVATVDLTTPEPKLLGEATLEAVSDYYAYNYGLYNTGSAQVAIGSTLAFANTKVNYTTNTPVVEESSLRVVDLSDPTTAKVKSVDLPAGLGTTGLVTSGSIVARSHYSVSPNNSKSVRFYLDRVDVSDPSDPRVLPSVNIPGSLLAFDNASSRAVTVDYRATVEEGITAQKCYERPYAMFDAGSTNYDYQTTPGTCTTIRFSLKLIAFDEDGAEVLGSYELGESERIGQFAVGDNRVFVTLASGYAYGYATVDCFGYCGGPSAGAELPVLTIAGLKSGAFEVGRLALEGGDWWGYSPIAASGHQAVLATGWRGKLSVIDADDAEEPSVLREADIGGYAQSLNVVGTTAIASLGQDGVQTIELGD